jgi:hypothetical protein
MQVVGRPRRRGAGALKAALEDAPREERTSVGELLDRMARQWLRERATGASESDAVQRRIRGSAERFVGSLAGGIPRHAEEPVGRTDRGGYTSRCRAAILTSSAVERTPSSPSGSTCETPRCAS